MTTTLAKVTAERDALADALISAGVHPRIVQVLIKDAQPQPELAALHGFAVGERVRITSGLWEGLEGIVDPDAVNRTTGAKVDTSRYLPLRVAKPPRNPIISAPDGGYRPETCEAVAIKQKLEGSA